MKEGLIMKMLLNNYIKILRIIKLRLTLVGSKD